MFDIEKSSHWISKSIEFGGRLNIIYEPFFEMCGPTISLTLHCDDDDDDDDCVGLSRHMGRKKDSNMVHEIAKIRFHNNVMFAHVTRWCRFFTCYTFMTPTSLATHSRSQEAVNMKC